MFEQPEPERLILADRVPVCAEDICVRNNRVALRQLLLFEVSSLIFCTSMRENNGVYVKFGRLFTQTTRFVVT